MKYVICDIDGCCLDPDERIGHLLAGDYDTFLSLWETDKPIPQGVFTYIQYLKNPKFFKVVFVTSRRERERSFTEVQLDRLFCEYEYEVWMRPNDDHREDCEVKLAILKSHGVQPDEVFIAFDDRNVICEAYRRHGIVAYQTATGY